MGLYDRIKDKAAGLVDQAKDAASEATGIDVDKALDVADSAVESAERLGEAADAIGEARDRLKGE